MINVLERRYGLYLLLLTLASASCNSRSGESNCPIETVARNCQGASLLVGTFDGGTLCIRSICVDSAAIHELLVTEIDGASPTSRPFDVVVARDWPAWHAVALLGKGAAPSQQDFCRVFSPTLTEIPASLPLRNVWDISPDASKALLANGRNYRSPSSQSLFADGDLPLDWSIWEFSADSCWSLEAEGRFRRAWWIDSRRILFEEWAEDSRVVLTEFDVVDRSFRRIAELESRWTINDLVIAPDRTSAALVATFDHGALPPIELESALFLLDWSTGLTRVPLRDLKPLHPHLIIGSRHSMMFLDANRLIFFGQPTKEIQDPSTFSPIQVVDLVTGECTPVAPPAGSASPIPIAVDGQQNLILGGWTSERPPVDYRGPHLYVIERRSLTTGESRILLAAPYYVQVLGIFEP